MIQIIQFFHRYCTCSKFCNHPTSVFRTTNETNSELSFMVDACQKLIQELSFQWTYTFRLFPHFSAGRALKFCEIWLRRCPSKLIGRPTRSTATAKGKFFNNPPQRSTQDNVAVLVLGGSAFTQPT